MEASESTDAEYYRYSLDIQRFEISRVQAGLRYVRLPFAAVFFRVENVCIVHFDPKKMTSDSYMQAQRQGLTLVPFSSLT